MEYVADQCLLKYRGPAEAAKQVELLLASATIFDGVAQKVAAPLPAAKATVLLSPSTRTRARAIKA